MQENKIFFEAKDIIKRFGRSSILKGLNLKVRSGEFISIFGPNGAGKTTFLKISAMIISPSEGDIFIYGKNTKDAGDRARVEIGFIAHDTFLYRNLTARENLEFYGKMYGVNDLKDTVESRLNSVGLLNRADDIITRFSRGMLQRLTIARAFLHDPSIMFLDEPYTGLDSTASVLLNNLIEEFYDTEKAGILTTHNLDQGYDIASRLIILDNGKIEFDVEKDSVSKQDFRNKYAEIISS
ncbi:MAG: ABC transporter ATP-binding protein [bacterium]|nr:ABC transporter ATP-binding protein [bacterium]